MVFAKVSTQIRRKRVVTLKHGEVQVVSTNDSNCAYGFVEIDIRGGRKSNPRIGLSQTWQNNDTTNKFATRANRGVNSRGTRAMAEVESGVNTPKFEYIGQSRSGRRPKARVLLVSL